VSEFWIYAVCFFSAILTLVTGFGLGTILTPTFAIVFEVKIAILLVAFVHFLNNLLKFVLFWKHVDLAIVRRFGVMSLIGALMGAILQVYLYSDVVKIILGIVLVGLGLSEMTTPLQKFRLPQKFDAIGGFLSGLLGGVVGNQGAIRSAYLLNYAIPKETFVATATLISLIIDVTRIPVYLLLSSETLPSVGWHWFFVVGVTFLGTLVGKRLITVLSLQSFKKVIAVFVLVVGIGYAFLLL
jgi:uncharacterized membrane protein YfcA